MLKLDTMYLYVPSTLGLLLLQKKSVHHTDHNSNRVRERT